MNKLTVQNAKTPSGELYRSIQQQSPQNQGLWFVAPDGKVLGSKVHYQDEKTMTVEARAAMAEALKAFGPVSVRRVERVDPQPFRGLGLQSDGSVTLAASVRFVERDKLSDAGAYDSIKLNVKEWAAFTPPKATPGHTWSLPAAVGGRFSRCLSPISDLTFMPRPEDVTLAEFRAAVVSVDEGVATLAYRGRIAASYKHPYEKGRTSSGEADVRGAATYDVKKGRMLSLTLIFDGTHRNYQPYDQQAVTVAAVEWRSERPPRK